MNKEEQRKYFKTFLGQLDETKKQHIEKAIHNNLVQSTYWKNAQSIGITVSREMEWDTKPLIEIAWSQGKTVCVPKCFPKDKELIFYKLSSFQQLETVYYRLLEPKPVAEMQMKKSDIELIIVPGIAFDYDGYRIGFGGGYYDRFLKDYQGLSVSIAMNNQIVEAIDKKSHDIPVDHLVSETGVIK